MGAPLCFVFTYARKSSRARNRTYFWGHPGRCISQADQYFAAIERWIERFKSCDPVDARQPVLVPGEPELQFHEQRMSAGIPLTPAVMDQLFSLADRFGLPKPVPAH